LFAIIEVHITTDDILPHLALYPVYVQKQEFIFYIENDGDGPQRFPLHNKFTMKEQYW